jgi:uncharacterized protein (TIGR00251 family)
MAGSKHNFPQKQGRKLSGSRGKRKQKSAKGSAPREESKPKRERNGRSKGADLASFCAWEGDTLILNILGKPNAGKDAIGKVQGKQLRVTVTEAPVAGRATDHMVRFLAARFGVAPSDIEVVFGRFNVNKQMRIRSPQKLPSVIQKLLCGTLEKP